MREIQTIIAIVNKAINKKARLVVRVTLFLRTYKTVMRLNKRALAIIKLEQSPRILGQEDRHKDQVDWSKVNQVNPNQDSEINKINNLIPEVWTRIRVEAVTLIKNQEA